MNKETEYQVNQVVKLARAYYGINEGAPVTITGIKDGFIDVLWTIGRTRKLYFTVHCTHIKPMQDR